MTAPFPHGNSLRGLREVIDAMNGAATRPLNDEELAIALSGDPQVGPMVQRRNLENLRFALRNVPRDVIPVILAEELAGRFGKARALADAADDDKGGDDADQG